MPVGNIKTYIIDASFVLAFLLPDERKDEVEIIFEQYAQGKINFISSIILPLEVLNGLKYAVSSKRLAREISHKLIDDLLNYDISFPQIDYQKVLDLSLKKDLSVYDASYLFLSKSHKLPLLSLDERLK